MGFVEFHNVSDRDIWDRFREGSRTAFEVIYERHIQTLANYGRRLCRDHDMVKDAIQDMFIDIWRSRTNLGTTNSIKYYLIKAFRRNLVKKINRSRRFDTHEDHYGNFDGAFELSHDLHIIDEEINEEQIRQLSYYLTKLPSRQKEALFLRFYGGLNYTEIAETMGINQQSAHNMVFRALEMLRTRMSYALPTVLCLLAKIF
jgi:RNA polymerase sigma factor (sigma-70 family)